MPRIERIGTGKIIEALATLVRASYDYEPPEEPDKLDPWRALVVAARLEYDELVSEIRRLRVTGSDASESGPGSAKP